VSDSIYATETFGDRGWSRRWCQRGGSSAAGSRYLPFLDYGDAEQYRRRLEQAGRDCNDLKKDDSSSTTP